MIITYVFHSCFIVELTHYILIFDYFKGTLPNFDLNKEIIFFVSHHHGDHYTKHIWNIHHPNISYIIDDAIKLPQFVEGISVCGNQDFIYKDLRIHTLSSTDEGVAFFIEVEGKQIYHAGDLNWWHWEGEPDKDNDWQDQVFHQEIEYLRNRHIDIAFLPLDPRLEKSAWWGFLNVLDIAHIDHVFPMHFHTDIKKMHAYLDMNELASYKSIIEIIQKKNQVFSFR